jgi:hypothetical protein
LNCLLHPFAELPGPGAEDGLFLKVGARAVAEHVKGVFANVEAERGGVNGGVVAVVEGKLSHGKDLIPVGLVMIDVATEVVFQAAVHSLSLAISLGVEGCGEAVLDIEEVHELLLVLAGED